jgi:hypothetical protein
MDKMAKIEAYFVLLGKHAFDLLAIADLKAVP